MSPRLTILTLLSLGACAPASPAPVPVPSEWRIALPPVSAPPAAWRAHRPASPAAVFAASVRGDRLIVQVDDHCALGVHAHVQLQRDSLFVTLHWGTVTERSNGAAPNCYTNCDVACAYLFSGQLPFLPGRHVVAILFPASTPGDQGREGWRVVAMR